jgi:hypothetical protein
MTLSRNVGLLLLLLGACSKPFAFRDNPGCFEVHVKEAVDLYEVRKPLYSELSRGRSAIDLWILTFMQKLNLPKARNFDARATDLRARGVEGLGCNEFVSMSGVAAFQKNLVPQAHEQALSLDVSELSQALTQQLKAGKYRELILRVDLELDTLKSSPHFNCLVRHFLESIARAADLLPRYQGQITSLPLDDASRAKLLEDVRSWSDDFIDLHISVLGTAKFLDRRVEGLQKEGLALFCQDLPHIPKYVPSPQAL